jgi:hypothetical protein
MTMKISQAADGGSRFPSRPPRRVLGTVLAILAFLAMSVLIVLPASATGSSARRVGLFSCTNKVVVRPGTFIITCADAYTQLTSTKWTEWGSTTAVGTTRFAMNLCTPSCVASKMSYFPGSVVRLTTPVRTAAHGWLFSKLTVTYRFHGKMKTFHFSWSGDPAFKT